EKKTKRQAAGQEGSIVIEEFSECLSDDLELQSLPHFQAGRDQEAAEKPIRNDECAVKAVYFLRLRAAALRGAPLQQPARAKANRRIHRVQSGTIYCAARFVAMGSFSNSCRGSRLGVESSTITPKYPIIISSQVCSP